MLRRYRVLQAGLILMGLVVGTLGHVAVATAAVDAAVVGSWWQDTGEPGLHVGLILRSDGSFTHAENDYGDRDWDAGIFSASGGDVSVTIQQSSEPGEIGQPMTGTYSVVGFQLTLQFTGGDPEVFQRAANYANLPSGAVGEWLQTELWENGVEVPLTWVSRMTFTDVGITTCESLDEGAQLDWWGLVSVNAAHTEATILVVWDDDPQGIGPLSATFSLTANNMEFWPPNEYVKLSRLLSTVDSDLVGTWVITGETQLSQVAPQNGLDYYSTALWKSNHDYSSNGVSLDHSERWWERGEFWNTADGYLLVITSHVWDSFVGTCPVGGTQAAYSRAGDVLTFELWTEEDGQGTTGTRMTMHKAHLVSGHVLDGSSQPVDDVIIEADSGKLAVTDDNGLYDLGLINSGQYTLTPISTAWDYDPTSRQRTVPPDRTNVDFTATVAVDAAVVGSWWQNTGDPDLHAGLILRSDGSFTRADNDHDIRMWCAGTFTADGDNVSVTIQQGSEPGEIGQTMTGTYTIVGSELTFHFIGEDAETYDQAANYAGLPTGAVGQWLTTGEWENSVPNPLTWVSRDTITDVGIITGEQLVEGVELDTWGLLSINSAGTELTVLTLYSADPTEGMPIGPAQMSCSLTANNMEIQFSPTGHVRLSRLLSTVDSDLVGTWVETDETQLAQVGPQAALDWYWTVVMTSNGDFYTNDVELDKSWWEWERGQFQNTADGYVLFITSHCSDPADAGEGFMFAYSRAGNELIVDFWEEEEEHGPPEHWQSTLHTAHSVSGHVLDEGSQPVEGVVIEADPGNGMVVTDDRGFYQLGLIDDGQYTLTPSDGWSFDPTSRQTTVPPDRTGLDFTATVAAYEISGIVQESGDAPIEGVSVTLTPQGGGTALHDTTGSDGLFSFTDLDAGTYDLDVTKEDWDFDPVAPLTVAPNQTNVIITGWQTAFEISGRVVDAENNGIEGVIIDYNGDGTTVNPDGSFRLRHLSPGQYIVSPHKDGIVFDPANVIVTVAPDRTDLVFVGSVTITGHVEGNSPLADVIIAISESSSGTPLGTATTGADGNYTATDLLPVSQYLLVPVKDSWLFTPQTRAVDLGPTMVADFVGTAGTTYSISGTILDGSGNPLPGALVSAIPYHAITTGSGSYQISGVPAAPYTVTPTLAGYAFTPPGQLVTITDTNATGVDFTGTPLHHHTFDAGQRMIGIPLDVSGSPTMELLLGTDAIWWDPQGPGYVTIGAPTEYVLGRGYWADFAAQTQISMGGAEVSGLFTYDVADGWNIVSSPYNSQAALASVTDAPTLQPFGWTYQGNGYELVANIADSLNLIHNTFQPWWGYWVLSSGAGPMSWNYVAPSAQNVELLQIGRADGARGGWQIQLTARAGSRVDLCNYCGMAAEQTAQALSIPNPPAASGSVDLYFPTDAGLMAADIRGISQEQVQWDFEVRTDLADTEVTIGYPDLSVVPDDYQLVLTDVDAGKSVYMRTSHGYSYDSGPQGGVRHFRISAKPADRSSLIVTGVTTQQVNSQCVEISYVLSATAQVEVTVRNIAGRIISRLPSQSVQPTGTHTITWNLCSVSGSRVPAGTYLCVITARTEDGQAASCVRPITISR